MGDHSIIDVAAEIQRFVSALPDDISDDEYEARLLAFRRKFPELTAEQLERAFGIASDEEMMTLELGFEAECGRFATFLDGLPKRPEALQEPEEFDERTPLRRFLAKRSEQQ